MSSLARDLLRRRGGLESAYGSSTAERETTLEAVGIRGEQAELAVRALESTVADRPISIDELPALEAVIWREECPTFELLKQRFVDQPSGRWKRLRTDAEWLTPFIFAAGRLDCESLNAGFAGTGFLVGKGLLMTNRHVALLFAQYSNRRMYYEVEFDLRHDKRDPFEREFARILSVEMIHPFWDVALLRVDVKPDWQPVKLASSRPDTLVQRPIAAIGYPFFRFSDSEYDRKILLDNFGDVPGYKRLQPGHMTDLVKQTTPFNRWPDVMALGHDASTLGGNSGSLVVDLDAKVATGVHFGGIQFKTNWAVPSWELFRDRRIREAGVEFTNRSGPEPSPDPDVEAAWRRLLGPPAAVPVPGAVQGGTTSESPVEGPAPIESFGPQQPAAAGPTPALDWENVESLAEAAAASPNATRSLLVRAVGERQADTILQAITPRADASSVATSGRADPDLPEIVLIPDLFGSRLRDALTGAPIWLSNRTFKRNFAESLALRAEGANDRVPRLEPCGPLPVLYRAVALRFRSAGFVVHEIAYDWRKRIEVAADQLHFFLEALSADRPRRFALVAHGMGGLVACLYAHRHVEWQDRVQRAVLVGVPLSGTFVALEAALGVHALQRKLSLVDVRGATPEEMRELALSFPSLLEMLPAPSAFPTAAALYKTATWPGPSRPSQSQLDWSLNLKSAMQNNPLCDRAAAITSIERGTCDTLSYAPGKLRAGTRNGPGDGMVPAASAVLNGQPLAVVDEDHWLMLGHGDTQRAIIALLRDGCFPTDLASDPRSIDQQRRIEAPQEQLDVVESLPSPAQVARERLERELDFELIRWLFDASVRLP